MIPGRQGTHPGLNSSSVNLTRSFSDGDDLRPALPNHGIMKTNHGFQETKEPRNSQCVEGVKVLCILMLYSFGDS